MQKHGVTYQDGKMSVVTDKPAMTRRDEVASSQAAVGAAARYVSEHRGAFAVGGGAGSGAEGGRDS